MNSEITSNKNNLNEDNIFENIFDYEEYYLINEKAAYKFIIGKTSNGVIIKCKNYELTFNNNDLFIFTKSKFETIDDSFLFIINIFEENKVTIKDIIINKNISLLLNININNKQKDIEIILLYNKKNKDLNINEYKNKINYKFKKAPNLKYKLDISHTNTKFGLYLKY